MTEMASVAIFALTIVGVYLLFYPDKGPLYEVAVTYLPPEAAAAESGDDRSAAEPPTGGPHQKILKTAGSAAAIDPFLLIYKGFGIPIRYRIH